MGIRDWFSRLWRGSSGSALSRSLAQLATAQKKSETFFTVVVGGSGLPAFSLEGGNLTALLEAATWSYACIRANAEAASSLQWIVQRAGGPGEDRWVPDPDHPLNRLLQYPFGQQTPGLPRWSWQQLMETLFLHRYLAGNGYLGPKVQGGRVVLVELLLPTNMQVETNSLGYPDEYVYSTGAGTRKLPPSRVVHFMNASPDSLSSGQNPFAAAEDAVEIDQTAQERQRATLENRIAPGLILQVEAGLTDPQRQELQEELEANYQAAADEGTPFVMGDKVKVIATPEQKVYYKETRLLARDEILAIFGTPPPVIGVMESATLQNFDRALRIWWMNKLFPLIQDHANALNQQLVWPVYGDSVRLWYDLTGTEIALVLLREKIAAAQDLVNLGYPPNMAASQVGLGMPRVDALDEPLQTQIVAGRGE